jgi:hypothetical protein
VKKLAALLLLTASCAAEQTKEVDLARKQFEEWKTAAAAGDAEKTLSGLSDVRKSEWLFQLLEENDGLAKRWRGELTGGPRTDLDLWWGIAHRNGSGRERLNASVLYHPSFIALFRDYFTLTASEIKRQMAKLEILKVYGDESGITITVRQGPGARSEMYGMVYEHDGWKVDTYSEGLTTQK